VTQQEINDDGLLGVSARPLAPAEPPERPPEHAEIALRRRRRSTQRVIGLALGTLALVALVSFWAGSKVHGSATRLPKNVIQPVPTTPIKHGRLVNELAAAGTVVGGRQRPVTVLASSLDGPQPIVTQLPLHSGSRLVEGRVLAEIAGRPTIVLRGTIPMYRDLRRGSQGGDVTQLQRALERLGYSVDDAPGRFGLDTAAAAAALFRARGFDLLALQPATSTTSSRPARRALERLTVPASNVVFLGSLPAEVSSVSARVGAAASGPLLSVSTGEPLVRVSIDPAQASTLRRGMRAAIYVGSRRLRGRVLAVSSSGSATLRVAAAKRYLRVHQAVRVTVSLGSSRSRVWSVPYSAVFTAPDGATFIRLKLGHGWRRVPVRLGYSANGYVAVRAVGGTPWHAGQPVAVAG
jgi:peptidoglycan hydrolase-like protein with peptidoglycan-binding domain